MGRSHDNGQRCLATVGIRSKAATNSKGVGIERHTKITHLRSAHSSRNCSFDLAHIDAVIYTLKHGHIQTSKQQTETQADRTKIHAQI